jgi:hypothetical protein
MTSFLQGRQVVSRTGVILETPASQLPGLGDESNKPELKACDQAAPNPGASPSHGEKSVEAVTVDGVVQKIIVTCSCGEKIEVHCGY